MGPTFCGVTQLPYTVTDEEIHKFKRKRSKSITL